MHTCPLVPTQCSTIGPVRWLLSLLVDHPLLLLLSAATAKTAPKHLPGAAISSNLLATYLPFKRSKHDANVLLAGAPHATAAVLAPGFTTTHMKVTVAATHGRKMPSVTKFSPAVPHGPTTAKPSNNAAWVMETPRIVLCTPTTARSL